MFLISSSCTRMQFSQIQSYFLQRSELRPKPVPQHNQSSWSFSCSEQALWWEAEALFPCYSILPALGLAVLLWYPGRKGIVSAVPPASFLRDRDFWSLWSKHQASVCAGNILWTCLKIIRGELQNEMLLPLTFFCQVLTLLHCVAPYTVSSSTEISGLHTVVCSRRLVLHLMIKYQPARGSYQSPSHTAQVCLCVQCLWQILLRTHQPHPLSALLGPSPGCCPSTYTVS